jgi:hypothetical protein
MKERKLLHEFYAVTQTSVYLVTDKKGKNFVPLVKKIALKGESKIPVGGRLKEGSLVGITRHGIVLYDDDRSPFSKRKGWKDPEEVNIAFHGGKTSPLVALFLNRKNAFDCFNSKSLQTCDCRWQRQTKQALEVIGKDHPVFVVSELASPLV